MLPRAKAIAVTIVLCSIASAARASGPPLAPSAGVGRPFPCGLGSVDRGLAIGDPRDVAEAAWDLFVGCPEPIDVAGRRWFEIEYSPAEIPGWRLDAALPAGHGSEVPAVASRISPDAPTLYARRRFSLSEDAAVVFNALPCYFQAIVDDGFQAFLNASSSDALPFAAAGLRRSARVPCDRRARIDKEWNSPRGKPFPLWPLERAFRAGDNVVAIEVHDGGGDDLFLAANLVVLPRIQVARKSATRADVAWDALAPMEGQVEYREAGTEQRFLRIESPAAMDHVVTIDGLSSGVEYEYAVSMRPDGGAWVPITCGTLRFTSDSPGAAARLAAFGDSGTAAFEQFAIRDLVAASDPGAVLIAGDVVYESAARDDFDPKYFLPYADLAATRGIYTAIGNHDARSAGNAGARCNYYEFFELPAPISDLDGPPIASERFYSFDLGDAHIVSIDSTVVLNRGRSSREYGEIGPENARLRNCAGGAEHPSDCELVEFLVRDLSAAAGRWRIIFLHHPLYTSHGEGATDHDHEASLRAALEPILERYGVDLVIAGHCHHYERSRPIRGGEVVDGFAGAAGAASRRLDYQAPRAAFAGGTMHYVSGQGGGRGISGVFDIDRVFGATLLNRNEVQHYLEIDIRGRTLTVTPRRFPPYPAVIRAADGEPDVLVIEKELAFVRGDLNQNLNVDLADAVLLLRHTLAREPIDCLDAGDVDGDGRIGLADAADLLMFLFESGRPPPAPFPSCGRVPGGGALGCESATTCLPGWAQTQVPNPEAFPGCSRLQRLQEDGRRTR
jgi:hypothetical protein